MGLEKLNIVAFKDEKFTQKVGGGVFSVQLNPEKYSLQFGAELKEDTTLNTAGVTPKYVAQKPEDLALEFYLDATGAVTGTKSGTRVTDVNAEVDRLRTVVGYNGSIHSPNYLRVLWGKLSFDCVLLNLSIEYVLFTPGGVPLRAKVTIRLKQYVSPEKMELEAGKNSPDLTHRRTVGAGDTLPLMCFHIYQDSKYYLEVARFNGLNDFRNLEPGQQIFFPPLGD
jgi:hypothetical protein